MDHQSNGAAEVIVHMLRSRASPLVQQKTKLLVEIWFLECNVQQHIITEKHGGSQAPCGVPNQPRRHLHLPQMERSCSWSLSQLQFGTWRSGYRSFH
jgi:hypothetical protein